MVDNFLYTVLSNLSKPVHTASVLSSCFPEASFTKTTKVVARAFFSTGLKSRRTIGTMRRYQYLRIRSTCLFLHRFREICIGITELIHPPPASDTIPNGVTRDSIIRLAKRREVNTFEQPIEICTLISNIKSGRCTEIFACGTAATMTPVSESGEKNGTRYPLPEASGALSLELRDELLAIRTGLADAPEAGWVYQLETE